MRPRAIALPLAALIVLAVLRGMTAPPWPDDWDGIGFVESIARFDLDAFTPHAPGYPVYVALLRVAGWLVRDPIAAANAVAVTSGVAVVALAACATSRGPTGRERAWWVAAFVALAPLLWRTSTAIGSEAPALALVCAALCAATLRGANTATRMGIAIGAALGVRLSWAPLLLALLALAPRGTRVRAAVAAALATLAWAIPFVLLVGPRHLLQLAMVHASGHFHVWGGTTLSDPGVGRIAYLARDLFDDGLGVGADALGVAIGVALAGLVALGVHAWRERGWPHARLPLVLLPYLAWLVLGQNVRQQPRHAVPLVVALVTALAVAATTSPRARVLGGVLLALLSFRTARDAYDRRLIPPAGAQLVTLVRALPEAGSVAVFGGPSARFFELAPGGPRASVAGTLGDARLVLSRAPSLPHRVIVTGELGGIDTSGEPVVHLATLCRPARLDRRAPCLDVYDWRAAFLAR